MYSWRFFRQLFQFCDISVYAIVLLVKEISLEQTDKQK